jgi:hypothetical protein
MSISVQSLKKAVRLAEQIEDLEAQLASILGKSAAGSRSAKAIATVQSAPAPKATGKKRPHFSAAARASIARAQKARWAKVKEGKAAEPTAMKPEKAARAKKKGKMSAAGRAAVAAAQKKRWAKVKSAKAKAGK